MAFKPMLSATAKTMDDVLFPVLASPKLDGIRCVMREGKAYSRNLELIPNRYIQEVLAGLPDLDGEIICGEPVGKDVWNRSQSGVMKVDGKPEFTFWVFDVIKFDGTPFSTRYAALKGFVEALPAGEKWAKHIKLVEHVLINDATTLTHYEGTAVALGFEGVMVRYPSKGYKCGRSTVNEKGLMKIKRWNDSEGRIVGFKEQMSNQNAATEDKLGRSKRLGGKGGHVAKDTLGSFILKWVDANGVEQDVDCGSGLTDELRAEYWAKRDTLKGKFIKFKYQGLTDAGIPRFPIFLGERDPRDM